jgi:hypothetical protein
LKKTTEDSHTLKTKEESEEEEREEEKKTLSSNINI